jgi:hypothetical protein
VPSYPEPARKPPPPQKHMPRRGRLRRQEGELGGKPVGHLREDNIIRGSPLGRGHCTSRRSAATKPVIGQPAITGAMHLRRARLGWEPHDAVLSRTVVG